MIQYIKDQIQEGVEDKIQVLCPQCKKKLDFDKLLGWVNDDLITVIRPYPCPDCYKER